MTRPRQVGVLAAGLVLLLGACTVQPSESESRQDQFERDRAVRYDLRTPPASAQELGVRDGIASGAFNRVGDAYWTYELQLPGGKVFTTEGFGHRVIVENGPSRTFVSSSVLINSVSADAVAAAAELERGVALLGLEEASVADWSAKARAAPASARNRIFNGEPQGYLQVFVDVRRDSLTDEVGLDWEFFWDPPMPNDTGPSSDAPTT